MTHQYDGPDLTTSSAVSGATPQARTNASAPSGTVRFRSSPRLSTSFMRTPEPHGPTWKARAAKVAKRSRHEWKTALAAANHHESGAPGGPWCRNRQGWLRGSPRRVANCAATASMAVAGAGVDDHRPGSE